MEQTVYVVNTPQGERRFTQLKSGVGTTVYRCRPASSEKDDNSVEARLDVRKKYVVTGIRDHTYQSGKVIERNAVVNLDNGDWAFAWNVYEEVE